MDNDDTYTYSASAGYVHSSPRRGGICHYIFSTLLYVRNLLELVCKFKSGSLGRYSLLKMKFLLYEAIKLSSLDIFYNFWSYQPNFTIFGLK